MRRRRSRCCEHTQYGEEVPLGYSNPAIPARKTTNFGRNLSFFSYIRLAVSGMRKRVIFASQVICASRAEDYKANIISL